MCNLSVAVHVVEHIWSGKLHASEMCVTEIQAC
jgi:hypothetical protein